MRRAGRGEAIHAQGCCVLKTEPCFISRPKSPRSLTFVGRDSSVGIATRYGLDGPEIRLPVGSEIFPYPSRPALGAHPASYTMSIGSFPGVKRPGRGADHQLPSSAEVKERVWAIPLLHLWVFVACFRVNFTFTFTFTFYPFIHCDFQRQHYPTYHRCRATFRSA